MIEDRFASSILMFACIINKSHYHSHQLYNNGSISNNVTIDKEINLQQISSNDSLVAHFRNLDLKIFDQYALPSSISSRLSMVLIIVPFNEEHLLNADWYVSVNPMSLVTKIDSNKWKRLDQRYQSDKFNKLSSFRTVTLRLSTIRWWCSSAQLSTQLELYDFYYTKLFIH